MDLAHKVTCFMEIGLGSHRDGKTDEKAIVKCGETLATFGRGEANWFSRVFIDGLISVATLAPCPCLWQKRHLSTQNKTVR